MALNLYRRHFRSAGKCVGGHAPDSRNYESDELRRAWKKCHCPIYADGTLSGKFSRQNTKQTNWGEARTISAAWETAGRWDEPSEPIEAPKPDPKAKSDGPPTIELATDAYLANRAGRKISDSTLRKFKTFVKQLREFAAAKGYVTIDQFDAVDIDEFYAGWRDGIRAKGKKLGRLKGFFKFCVRRKWVKENPAEDLEAPVGAGTAANRIPLTDPELVRIYKACDELPDVEWKNHLGKGVWRGEDVKTMIMLLCWTGLGPI